VPSFDVVTLFNSNPDAIVRITGLLESAGFTVVPALIPEVRDGRCDVDALMTDHDPSVVVYEIGRPYDEHWAMFEEVRARPSMCDCRFVLTAADAAEVERLAGDDERIFEIVDKDSDPGDLVHAVKEAARARALIHAGERHADARPAFPQRTPFDVDVERYLSEASREARGGRDGTASRRAARDRCRT